MYAYNIYIYIYVYMSSKHDFAPTVNFPTQETAVNLKLWVETHLAHAFTS